MATTEDQIHSLHINVGNGDAAIHLLVTATTGQDDHNSAVKPTLGTVKKAVLVDGGKPATVSQIKRTISYIESTYTITTDTKKLQFDGVVVTKWSVDHSAGLLKLIIDDLTDKHPDGTSGQCSFFKYASDAPTTVLYSPYWKSLNAASKIDAFQKVAPPSNIKIPKNPNKPAPKHPKTSFDVDDASQRIVDFSQATITWASVCKLAAGATELIGQDLFNPTPTATPTAAVKANLQALVGANTGLFCVGADGQCFSSADTTDATKTPPTTVPKGTITKVSLLKTVQRGSPSISLLAVVKGKPQHYFSGDSDPQLDSAVADWVNLDNTANTVPVLKLSNHGSLASISTDLLDKFQPAHFICSAGASLTNLHPRWELIVLLRAYMMRKSLDAAKAHAAKAAAAEGGAPNAGGESVRADAKEDDAPQIKPFFHPTNYPAYLTSGKDSQLPIDFGGFLLPTNPESSATALQGAISKYDDSGLCLSIIEKALEALKGETDESKVAIQLAAARTWVTKWLRNILPSISYSKPEQHPVLQAKTNTNAAVTLETQLLCIKAVLSSSDPVISYINGAHKVVGNSEDEAAHAATSAVNSLDSFSKNFTLDKATRATPWTQSLASIDAAPGGVSLPQPVIDTLKRRDPDTKTAWTDFDDEVKRDNFVAWLDRPGEKNTPKIAPAYTVIGTTKATAYYASSSTFDKFPDPAKLRDPGDPDFTSFIEGFEPGFIAFQNEPQGAKVTLDPNTNLWAYLMSAKAIQSELSFDFDTTTPPKMTGLHVDCKLFGDDKVLSFNNSNVADQFGSELTSDIYKLFAIKDTGVVLVGLTNDATWQTNFSDICTAFQMTTDKPPKGALKMIIDALDATTKLIPQAFSSTPAVQPQNALWMFSGDPFRFALHLTFTVDASAVQKVKDQVKAYLNTGADWADKVQAAAEGVTLEATLTGTYQLITKADGSFGYAISTESSLRFNFTINVGGLPLPFAVDISKSGDLQCSITPGSASVSLGTFYDTVASIVGGPNPNVQATTFLDESHISLQDAWIARKEGSNSFGINLSAEFFVRSEVSITLGFNYSSSQIYQGGLLLPPTEKQKEKKLLPDYDPLQNLGSSSSPLLLSKLAGTGFPDGILDQIDQFQVTFDKAQKQFTLIASLESKPKAAGDGYVPAFDFSTLSLTATKDWSETDADANNHKSNASSVWTMEIDATVILNGAPDAQVDPATLTASIKKSAQSQWTVEAHLENFQLGVLISHFPQGYQNATSDFFSKIMVSSLDVFYTHDPADGKASSFLMSGVIQLGLLELRLAYQYVNGAAEAGKTAAALEKAKAKPDDALTHADLVQPPAKKTDTDWSFDAYLGAKSGQSSTIGEILDSIDDGLSQYLPDFVSNTEIAPANPDEGNPAAYFGLAQVPPKNPDGTETDRFLMCTLYVQIGDFNFTFIQLTDKTDQKTATTTPGDAPPAVGKAPRGAKAKPKRVFRFSLAKIPLIDDIPLINKLPQPFDDLEYVWVSYPGAADEASATSNLPHADGTGETDSAGNPTTLGFTTDELGWINKQLDDKKIPTLQFKQSGSDKADSLNKQTQKSAVPDEPAKDKVMLKAGQHFIVTHKGEAILDYVFGSKNAGKPTPQQPPVAEEMVMHSGSGQLVPRPRAVRRDVEGQSPKPDGTPGAVQKGAVGTKVGPLSIENVGLKFDLDSNTLWILMDASLLLGPITFELIGFGIGLHIGGADGIKNLSESEMLKLFQPKYYEFSLKGMEVAFSQPPLTIAGIFIHEDTAFANTYSGGIAVGFPPYLFVAVGEYSEVKTPAYKSFFVYAKLDGPLVSLEFATIEGVRLGFGYNSSVLQPTIDQLADFPFIDGPSAAAGGPDLRAILSSMQRYVKPMNGSYWGAAGMKITAFDFLDCTAVLLLQFGSGGCDISIFGDALVTMPPDSPPSASIVYLLIDFAIELSITEGFLRVEAALAPVSHVYVPQCHIYGGFALCYWFSPNEHSGDWVFSAGGYHKAFSVPAHVSLASTASFENILTDSSTRFLNALVYLSRLETILGSRVKCTSPFARKPSWQVDDFIYKSMSDPCPLGVMLGWTC
jgi:hypothetical protein